MDRQITCAGLLLALLFFFTGTRAATPLATAAAAQPEVRLQAWRVNPGADAGGKEQLQPLEPKVSPGDVIEYEAHYINGTARAVQNVQLTLPVPAGGVQYLPLSGSSTPVHSASVDGLRFEPVPLRREVRLPDGRRAMQEVPLSEYRFLRWNLGDLPAGSQRTVRARMQVPALAVASRS